MATLNISNKQHAVLAELIKDYGYASGTYDSAAATWRPLHLLSKGSDEEASAWAEVKAAMVKLRRAEVALELAGIEVASSVYSKLTPSAYNEYHSLRNAAYDSIRTYDNV